MWFHNPSWNFCNFMLLQITTCNFALVGMKKTQFWSLMLQWFVLEWKNYLKLKCSSVERLFLDFLNAHRIEGFFHEFFVAVIILRKFVRIKDSSLLHVGYITFYPFLCRLHQYCKTMSNWYNFSCVVHDLPWFCWISVHTLLSFLCHEIPHNNHDIFHFL